MSHSLGAKLSRLRHKGYITDIEYQRLKKALEQEPIITSTEDNAEMTYPQVEGITPTVVEPIGDDYKYIKSISNPTGIEFDIDIPKKVESYEKLLKHPVIKHIMDMDETPVTLSVSENPNNCDLISRQAVMDYIHRILNQGTGKKKSFEFIQKYVEKLPSIKPQVQTGHWEIANSFCTCDQCGYETRPWNNTLFCPNCGVKMKK